jgi:hypothetical protein
MNFNMEALEILADHLKEKGYLVQLVQAGWHPDYGSTPELRITRYAPMIGWWTKEDIEVTYDEKDCTVTANLDGHENYSKAYTSITVSLYDPLSIPKLERWIQTKAYPSASLVAHEQAERLKRGAKNLAKPDVAYGTILVGLFFSSIVVFFAMLIAAAVDGRLN